MLLYEILDASNFDIRHGVSRYRHLASKVVEGYNELMIVEGGGAILKSHLEDMKRRFSGMESIKVEHLVAESIIDSFILKVRQWPASRIGGVMRI